MVFGGISMPATMVWRAASSTMSGATGRSRIVSLMHASTNGSRASCSYCGGLSTKDKTSLRARSRACGLPARR